jgi:hypothetical protein
MKQIGKLINIMLLIKRMVEKVKMLRMKQYMMSIMNSYLIALEKLDIVLLNGIQRQMEVDLVL